MNYLKDLKIEHVPLGEDAENEDTMIIIRCKGKISEELVGHIKSRIPIKYRENVLFLSEDFEIEVVNLNSKKEEVIDEQQIKGEVTTEGEYEDGQKGFVFRGTDRNC